jgi:transposase
MILPWLPQKKEIGELFEHGGAAIAAGEVVVLYLDECHLLWDDARGYVWGKSNQRIEIPMTNFRDRQTYYGAIEHVSGEVTVMPLPAGNGTCTVAFIKHLRQKYPEKRLILLWDGAAYHRQGEMLEYLQQLNAGREPETWLVTCVLFAPNAPEQNPIEDVWLSAKQCVRTNWRLCATFRDVKRIFKEAIEGIFFDFEKLRMYSPNLELI